MQENRSDSIIRNFIARYKDVPYAVDGGPWKYNSNGHGPHISEGINCQFLFHQFLDEATGFRLSEYTLSKEIFVDDKLFIPITPDDGLQIADVFLFGKNVPEEELDPRTLHIASYTGTDTNDGQPLLVHHFGKREIIDENGVVLPEETGLQIWTRDQFNQPKYDKYYGKLWAVKRFNPEEHLSRKGAELELESVLSFFKKKLRSSSF